MTIYTQDEICQRYNVTGPQIDKCTRLIDMRDGSIYYQVSSQTTEDTLYTVRWSKAFGRLQCTCPAEGICWHMRASLCASKLHLQEERARMAAEVEAAAKAAEKRMSAPLNGNSGWSLLKPSTANVRGYDIRVQADGSTWMNERIHCWGKAGELPTEWQTVCADTSVVNAVIFYSSEAHKQSQKRRHLAEYTRQVAVAV